jgi:hypothetical protein
MDPFDKDAYWEDAVEQIQDLVQAQEEDKDKETKKDD